MPLNQDTIEYMEELVEDYLRRGQSFTSLDIANQTKQAGHFARNRWVAEWLRSNAIRLAHAMGALFNQSLIQVESKVDGTTLAYLYHNWQEDPDDYLDRDQNPVSAPRSTPNTAAIRAATSAGIVGQGGTGSFSTDGGGSHDPGNPATLPQHNHAVTDKTRGSGTTSPQRQGVQRDIYGRFTKNPSAPVSKPTHIQSQRRDSKGRYIKG